jgi:hypothetical protein
MDEPTGVEEYARGQDEAPGDLDALGGRPPGEEPEIFTGEVPPEEELGDEESGQVATGTPVTPNPSAADGEESELPESRQAVPATPTLPTRPIKIVLTLRPGRNPNESGSALIAAGADGHEPSFRYIDSADLAATLARVPEVVAATIASWDRRQKSGPIGSRPMTVGERSTVPATEPNTGEPGTTRTSAVAHAQPAAQNRRVRGAESSAEQASLFG